MGKKRAGGRDNNVLHPLPTPTLSPPPIPSLPPTLPIPPHPPHGGRTDGAYLLFLTCEFVALVLEVEHCSVVGCDLMLGVLLLLLLPKDPSHPDQCVYERDVIIISISSPTTNINKLIHSARGCNHQSQSLLSFLPHPPSLPPSLPSPATFLIHMGGDATLGFAAAAVAVVCFGSNFVPVKRYDTGDGIFFQFIMVSSLPSILLQTLHTTHHTLHTHYTPHTTHPHTTYSPHSLHSPHSPTYPPNPPTPPHSLLTHPTIQSTFIPNTLPPQLPRHSLATLVRVVHCSVALSSRWGSLSMR